jgi:hypothetical protein
VYGLSGPGLMTPATRYGRCDGAKTGRKIDGTLILPAELASTEAPNQYITIRVKVPESGLSAIKTVKPGE